MEAIWTSECMDAICQLSLDKYMMTEWMAEMEAPEDSQAGRQAGRKTHRRKEGVGVRMPRLPACLPACLHFCGRVIPPTPPSPCPFSRHVSAHPMLCVRPSDGMGRDGRAGSGVLFLTKESRSA